jgi:RNA polymerase sigma-70 factor (ECF subfamily)
MHVALTQTRIEMGKDSREQFEWLARQTHQQAFGFAFRLTGNAAEAEDLLQESFLRAFRFFGRYDHSMPFTSWLYRIMSNTHIDLLRRKGRLQTLSLEQPNADGSLATWDVADDEATAEQKLIDATLDAPLQAGLMNMTPEFRQAVVLADVEGMAYEEIAEVMGTSIGTVRSRIHRGRKQLRRYLLKAAPATYRSLINEL